MTMTRYIEPKISLGVIGQTIVFLFMLGGAYADIRSSQGRLRDELVRMLAEQQRIKDEYLRIDVYVAQQGAIGVRLESIDNRLKRIEERLDKR